MTAAFDSLIEDIDLSIRIKSPFDSLQLALKVLTLDQPADIRQYAIKASLISEEKVRKILSRRVDFQKDAVTRVKINII